LISIEKRRDIERKVIRGLLSITQFICCDVFRLHVRVAEQGDFSRPGQYRERGIQAHISSCRRAVGARDSGPERAAITRSPGQSNAWLKIEASKVVVLDFRSHVQGQAVGLQCYLILYEYVEQLARKVGGQKGPVNRRSGLVRGMAIAYTPNKILTGAQLDVVLKIEIKGIAELLKLRGVSIVSVQIKLQRDVAPA